MKFYNSTHNFYKLKNCFDIKNPLSENTKKDYCKGISESECINNINAEEQIEVYKKYNENTEISNLNVVKNEEFGFFMSFSAKEKCHVNIGNIIDLPWWGLKSIYRIKIESEIEDIEINLVDYVEDDSGIYVADRLLKSKSNTYEEGEIPLFISARVGKNDKSSRKSIKFTIYKSDGYEAETQIDTKIIDINIVNYIYDEDKDGKFFLDLWQHPCSWARAHGVEYFSEEHFIIIEKYLINMSKLGQKVINLIVSDFPWAGQKCFSIENNASRLYEYNMVGVSRKNGKLEFDFRNIEKYINLCLKVGINEEINIFGILGNWHGYDFGYPIKDYNDPIRIRVYDVDSKKFDYIRTKSDLEIYIMAIFEFLSEKKLLGITKIIGDEPGSPENFGKYKSFIDSCSKEKINYKYAVHSTNFIESYEGDVESFSLNTILLADIFDGRLKNLNITENFDKMTWYSCCFPDIFNCFIKSPLIETRYMGVYTYLLKMKGMLRWAYGIHVEDIDHDIRYKPAKWAAGDMFFVYPSKNGDIDHSIREKNLLYGIQDFNIFKKIENKIMRLKNTNKILDINPSIKYEKERIVLEDYIEFGEYIKSRNKLINLYKSLV